MPRPVPRPVPRQAIALEVREGEGALLLDVAATDHGVARVLTDGLAGPERRMLPLLGMCQKMAREAAFPVHLLHRGLRVDIYQAGATERDDKTRILNSALAEAGS